MAFSNVKQAASAHRIDSHRDQTMVMAQSTASALTALLAMAMLASSAVAQACPQRRGPELTRSLYSISTTEWSNDGRPTLRRRKWRSPSAGSCVCDTHETAMVTAAATWTVRCVSSLHAGVQYPDLWSRV